MSASIYHHCQTCKRTSFYLASTYTVVTAGLDCGAPMKPVTRHPARGNRPRLSGNYKKQQQKACKAANTIKHTAY